MLDKCLILFAVITSANISSKFFINKYMSRQSDMLARHDNEISMLKQHFMEYASKVDANSKKILMGF